MADLKISQLPVATTPLAGTELVPIVQGGTTDQTTVQAILTSAVPSGTANGVLYLNGSKVVTSGSALTFDGTNFTYQSAISLINNDGSGNRALATPFAYGGSGATGTLVLSSTHGNANQQRIRVGVGGAAAISFDIDSAEGMRLTSTGLGIGTSSPAAKLTLENGHINMTTDYGARWRAAGAGSYNGAMLFDSGNNWIVQLGSSLTENMRLTSTGLGIGTNNPGAKLDVAGSARVSGTLTASYSPSHDQTYISQNGAAGAGCVMATVNYAGNAYQPITYDASYYVWRPGGSERMRLDSSGNLGLGVTPSAWGSNRIAAQVVGASLAGVVGSNAIAELSANRFINSSGQDIYVSSTAASVYQQATGAHRWFTAPSGTAGNAISFTQAMTLDASGFLALGQTSASFQFDVLSGAAPAIRARASNSDNVLIVESTGTTSSSIRFINTSANNIYINANAGNLELYTANTARLNLKSTGQLRYIPLAADPAGAENGDVYYNSTTNKLRLYAAGAWVDLN